MSPKRLAFALVTLAAFASLGVADCIVRNRNVVVQNAVVAPVVAPVITPIATPVALYGASYDGSAAEIPKLQQELAALKAEHASRLAILETARDSLAARVAVLESKLNIAPPPAPKVEDVTPKANTPNTPKAQQGAPVAGGGNLLTLFTRNGCVQCHSAKKASGGLSLVAADGKTLTPLSCEMRLEIIRRINLTQDDKDVMPPKGKGQAVKDEDAAAFLDELTRNIPAKK